MGKLNSGHDLARSKYIIVASVAAVAMVLGAMSVGAIYKKGVASGNNPILSQVYPLPVSGGDNSSSGPKKSSDPQQITPTFARQQTIPLATHQDWGKKALLTDPVNIQVRVGLTQPIVQVNALGLNVGVPAVTDVLQGVGGVLDGVTGSNTTTATQTETTDTTPTDSGSGPEQTPATPPTNNAPSADEQASNLTSNSELNLVP
jgi:hypothetical protein